MQETSHEASHDSIEALKVCSVCAQPRRLKHFRQVRHDNPRLRPECNRCHAERERERHARRQERYLSQTASQIIRCHEPDKLAAVAAALSHRFRGHTGVAEAFYVATERARLAGRHATVGRMLMAIVHLIAAGEGRNGEELERIPDDVLERRSREALADLVESRPEIAIDALRERGYRVELPEDPPHDRQE
jgi:hypothetical protein